MIHRSQHFDVIDSSNSTAVEFLAWCSAREELYVIYRGSTKVTVYVNVRGDAIEEIERSDSLGRSLARLRRTGLHRATREETAAGIDFLRRGSGPHSWLRFPDEDVVGTSRGTVVDFEDEVWIDEEGSWLADGSDEEEFGDPYLETWDVAEVVDEETFCEASVDDVLNSDSERPLSMPFTDFCGAILDGCRLESANLEGALFDRASLVRSNLSKAFLFSASLKVAVLDFANLESAYLVGTQLQGARLIGANLRCANLIGANLEDADLRDADLRDAMVSEHALAHANLAGARLPNSV